MMPNNSTTPHPFPRSCRIFLRIKTRSMLVFSIACGLDVQYDILSKPKSLLPVSVSFAYGRLPDDTEQLTPLFNACILAIKTRLIATAADLAPAASPACGCEYVSRIRSILYCTQGHCRITTRHCRLHCTQGHHRVSTRHCTRVSRCWGLACAEELSLHKSTAGAGCVGLEVEAEGIFHARHE